MTVWIEALNTGKTLKIPGVTDDRFAKSVSLLAVPLIEYLQVGLENRGLIWPHMASQTHLGHIRSYIYCIFLKKNCPRPGN